MFRKSPKRGYNSDEDKSKKKEEGSYKVVYKGELRKIKEIKS